MWRLYTLVLVLPFLGVASYAEAASLYIDPAFSVLNAGDARQYAVRLDVDEEAGECVNAVDGVIEYSENINPVDISIGDSIFSIWVEQPTIDTENRRITFAGGVPSGYCGRVQGDPRLTNTLVEIIMRAPGFSIGGGVSSVGTTTGTISFSPESTAYLNDGFGTQANLNTFGAEISLTNERGDGIVDTWREEVSSDTTPPEEFSISLEQNDTTFGGKYFIVFNTTDKQTGIDQYQVMEEPISAFWDFAWGRADAPWITARSPYELQDQSLNSTIRVRAIDKAGNVYVDTLLPSDDLRTTPPGTVLAIVLLIAVAITIFIAILVGVFLWRRRRARKADDQNDAPISDEDLTNEE
jgi:hypothetical protein